MHCCFLVATVFTPPGSSYPWILVLLVHGAGFDCGERWASLRANGNLARSGRYTPEERILRGLEGGHDDYNEKEKKASGIKGQPDRGLGPDIPDTPTSAQIHASRRPGACKGAFRSSDTLNLLFRPRTPNCLSSLRAPAALIPSKISVPHLPLNPSGSPPLSSLYPPTLLASAPGTSPVCKIRQASDWLVCAPAEAGDAGFSYPIYRLRRRGQKKD